ncbi:MAG: serine protease [Anaerolineales bacterium]|nr:MAG: serine protease [Anaerolineales bacterium]
MPGIPSNLMRELHHVLASCHEFETTQQLKTLFVNSQLHPFGRSLPEGDSLQQRIDNAIHHLYNHYLVDGSNVLVNLLVVLADNYEYEYLGTQLTALADRLRIVLTAVPSAEVERYLTAYAVEKSAVGTQAAGLEQIVGASDLKEIMWLQTGLVAAKSVCRLLLENGGLGTGFLIGDDLLMTNNHVLPTPQSAEQAIAEFNYQYDYAGGMKSTTRYRIDTSRFKTNIALDYTLVGVKQDPSKENLHTWGCVNLNTQAPPVEGEHVIIIQHPGGEPKQIAMTGNYVKSVSTPYIRYTTDTRPGSSGAPVFNDGWQVIALHHRSVNEPSDPYRKSQMLNEGILIAQVRESAQNIWPGA